MSAVKEFLGITIFGNSLLRLSAAAAIFIVFAVFKAQISNILIAVARRIISKTKSDLNEMVEGTLKRPLEYLVVLFGFFIATRFIILPEKNHIELYLSKFVHVAVVLVISWFLFKFTDSVTEHLNLLWGGAKAQPDQKMGPIIRIAAKVVVCAFAFVMVVQNLGYSVTGLITGLGLGGLAFALAAKDTLANFFGAVVIFADKPFVTGETVKFGDTTGKVEQIGMRSTHVRTADNTLISVPNSIIANSIVENRSKSTSKKYTGTLALAAGVDSETLAGAVSALDTMLKKFKGISPEGAVVRLTSFVTGAINLTIDYTTQTTDEKVFLDLQQKINFAILSKLEELGIPLAGAPPITPRKKPAPPSSPFDFIV